MLCGYEKSQLRIYRVRWMDGEIELVLAESDEDLVQILEEECTPYAASIEEIYLVPPEDGPVRLNRKNWIRTVTDIMRLPAKRKLTQEDLDRAFSNLYGSPTGYPAYLQ